MLPSASGELQTVTPRPVYRLPCDGHGTPGSSCLEDGELIRGSEGGSLATLEEHGHLLLSPIYRKMTQPMSICDNYPTKTCQQVSAFGHRPKPTPTEFHIWIGGSCKSHQPISLWQWHRTVQPNAKKHLGCEPSIYVQHSWVYIGEDPLAFWDT